MKPNELHEMIEELEDAIKRVEWEGKTEAAMNSGRVRKPARCSMITHSK